MQRLCPRPLCELVIGPKVYLSDEQNQTLMSMETALERLIWLGKHYRQRVVPHEEPRTPVMLLMRDSDMYLRHVFPLVRTAVSRACRRSSLAPPRFYIYENNSSDGTSERLAKTEDISLCSETLPDRLRPSGRPRSSDRCGPMATMRNALCVMALRDLVVSEVAVMMDVDVWFTAATLSQLMNAVLQKQLDVATPLTSQGATHYFDTYALVLSNETPEEAVSRRDCHIPRCRACNNLAASNGHTARRSRPDRSATWRVKSAFGGIAAIRSSLLLRASEPWSSAHGQCEHVAFCRNKKVGIMATTMARWSPSCTESAMRVYNPLLMEPG